MGLEMLDDVSEGLCRVVRVTAADEAKAVALVRAHADKSYSLCDAMSFVVMQRMRIVDVIAFDRHFRPVSYTHLDVYKRQRQNVA